MSAPFDAVLLISFGGPQGLDDIRPFLANDGVPPERVEAMHEAWRKSVIMQIALWSRAYAPDLW